MGRVMWCPRRSVLTRQFNNVQWFLSRNVQRNPSSPAMSFPRRFLKRCLTENVPPMRKQVCKDVKEPVKVCNDVPEEVCDERPASVTNYEDEEQCSDFDGRKCVEATRQECSDVVERVPIQYFETECSTEYNEECTY